MQLLIDRNEVGTRNLQNAVQNANILSDYIILGKFHIRQKQLNPHNPFRGENIKAFHVLK